MRQKSTFTLPNIGPTVVVSGVREALEGDIKSLGAVSSSLRGVLHPLPEKVRSLHVSDKPVQALFDILPERLDDFVLHATCILSFYKGWTNGLVPDLKTGHVRHPNDSWITFFFHALDNTGGTRESRVLMGRAYLELVLKSELDLPRAEEVKRLLRVRFNGIC